MAFIFDQSIDEYSLNCSFITLIFCYFCGIKLKNVIVIFVLQQGQKQVWICLNCHVIGQTSICVKCKGSQIPYSMLSTGELQPIMSSNSDSQLLIIPITSSVSVHPPAPTLSQSSLPSPSASHFSLSSPASLQSSPLTSAIPPRQVKQIVLVQAPSSSMQPKVRRNHARADI